VTQKVWEPLVCQITRYRNPRSHNLHRQDDLRPRTLLYFILYLYCTCHISIFRCLCVRQDGPVPTVTVSIPYELPHDRTKTLLQGSCMTYLPDHIIVPYRLSLLTFPVRLIKVEFAPLPNLFLLFLSICAVNLAALLSNRLVKR
jgi:hypothetical protein